MHVAATATVLNLNLEYILSFHWHVQNVTIPCLFQELLPFLLCALSFHNFKYTSNVNALRVFYW